MKNSHEASGFDLRERVEAIREMNHSSSLWGFCRKIAIEGKLFAA
jgi:hypothetical protein